MLTSALQLRSGTATTPVVARILEPLGPGFFTTRFIYGNPNSARLPGYRRVDLGLRRSWTSGTKDWTLSFQILNALARTNALQIDWDSYFVCRAGLFCGDNTVKRKGLPLLPSIGLEVRW